MSESTPTAFENFHGAVRNIIATNSGCAAQLGQIETPEDAPASFYIFLGAHAHPIRWKFFQSPEDPHILDTGIVPEDQSGKETTLDELINPFKIHTSSALTALKEIIPQTSPNKRIRPGAFVDAINATREIKSVDQMQERLRNISEIYPKAQLNCMRHGEKSLIVYFGDCQTAVTLSTRLGNTGKKPIFCVEYPAPASEGKKFKSLKTSTLTFVRHIEGLAQKMESPEAVSDEEIVAIKKRTKPLEAI